MGTRMSLGVNADGMPVTLWIPDVDVVGCFVEAITRGRPATRRDDKKCPLGGPCQDGCGQPVCIEDVLDWVAEYGIEHRVNLWWFLPLWQMLQHGKSVKDVAKTFQVPLEKADCRIRRAMWLYRRAKKATFRRIRG